MGCLEATTDTQKVQKTCPTCVSPVIEMNDLLQNKCFGSERWRAVSSPSFQVLGHPFHLFQRLSRCSLFVLTVPQQITGVFVFTLSMFIAFKVPLPGPDSFYRVRRGLECVWVRVLSWPDGPLKASVASYQPM